MDLLINKETMSVSFSHVPHAAYICTYVLKLTVRLSPGAQPGGGAFRAYPPRNFQNIA